MKTVLTRQGVRNLDDPKKSNARNRPREVTCFHAWSHSRLCGCDRNYEDDDFVHEKQCSRCAMTRRP